jgi:GTP-binding protein HflX
LPTLLTDLPNGVAISALKGEGLERLLERIEVVIESEMAEVDVVIPYEAGELVSLFHRTGTIELEEHTLAGTHIRGRVPRTVAGRFHAMGPDRPSAE